MPTAPANKFCRDCRFLEGEPQSVCARCANPVALAWLEAEAEPDMVTGELIIAPPHCKFLRILPESPCGPKGKLFEQAECPEGEHDWEHSFAFDVCTKCGKTSAEA